MPTDSPNTGSLSGTGGNTGRESEAFQNTGGSQGFRENRREGFSGLEPDEAAGTTAIGLPDRERLGGNEGRWENGGNGGGDMRGMKEQVKQSTQEAYDQARQFTNEALEKARRQWRESSGQFAERAQETVRHQKDRVCKGIDDAAQAAHAAARTLEERNDQAVARYAHMAGHGLEQVRDYLQAADVRDMADDVRGFARRHPEWILGGMFIAGLVLARFMKADRAIGPRGRPPQGADDSLYRDIFESQYEGDEYWDDDFEDGYGDSGAYWRNQGVAGYNPSGTSGSAGAGYGETYDSPGRTGKNTGSASGSAGFARSAQDMSEPDIIAGGEEQSGQGGAYCPPGMSIDDDKQKGASQ